jgi:glycine/D-amino acid oxidase-like deaminating enzyme
MKKIIESLNPKTDTVRIGHALRQYIIDVETNHGGCAESGTFYVDDCEGGLIIKKIKDGRIVLGVQDENGN